MIFLLSFLLFSAPLFSSFIPFLLLPSTHPRTLRNTHQTLFLSFFISRKTTTRDDIHASIFPFHHVCKASYHRIQRIRRKVNLLSGAVYYARVKKEGASIVWGSLLELHCCVLLTSGIPFLSFGFITCGTLGPMESIFRAQVGGGHSLQLWACGQRKTSYLERWGRASSRTDQC